MKPDVLPEIISGDRVVLRKIEHDMAAIMFHHVDEDRQRLREFLSWVDDINTLQDEQRYVTDSLARWEECSLFDFGLFSPDDDAFLGMIGLHTIAWDHDRAELGYWILKEHEGQGLMTDAVAALEAAAFELGFHRLEIRCNARNVRSAQLPRRNGYLLDGVLREDCVEHGTYRDTLVFSKLATDTPK